MVVQYCDVCNLVLNGCNIQAFVGFQLSEIPFVSLVHAPSSQTVYTAVNQVRRYLSQWPGFC